MDSELESNVAVRGGRTVEWPYTKENTTDCKFNRMHIFMTPTFVLRHFLISVPSLKRREAGVLSSQIHVARALNCQPSVPSVRLVPPLRVFFNLSTQNDGQFCNRVSKANKIRVIRMYSAWL